MKTDPSVTELIIPDIDGSISFDEAKKQLVHHAKLISEASIKRKEPYKSTDIQIMKIRLDGLNTLSKLVDSYLTKAAGIVGLIILILFATATDARTNQLTIWAEGPGSVFVDYVGNDGHRIQEEVDGYYKIENINPETPIKLTAAAYGSNQFIRWDGNLPVNGNPTVVFLTCNQSIVAVFDSYECHDCGNYYTYNCYDYGDCDDDHYYDDDWDCDDGDDDCCFIQSLSF